MCDFYRVTAPTNTQEKRDQILRGGWMEFLRSFFRSHEISLPFNRTNLVESFNHEEQSNKTEISTISRRCNSNDKHETKEENLCMNTLNCNLNAPFEEKPSTSDNGRLKRVNNFSSESKNTRDILNGISSEVDISKNDSFFTF